jgi:hypothetical protein
VARFIDFHPGSSRVTSVQRRDAHDRFTTPVRLTRWVRGGVIAGVLALLWAAPVAAAQPTRLVYFPAPHVDPAGTACSFDVLFEPLRGWDALSDFSNGAEVLKAQVNVLVTNETNGASYVHKAIFHAVDRYNSVTGIDRGVTNGQVLIQFLPGDVGPFGVVGASGALLRFVGTVWYTWDANANALTEFSYEGTVTDVCALIS